MKTAAKKTCPILSGIHTPNKVSSEIYGPLKNGTAISFFDSQLFKMQRENGQLPVPPFYLRMGYSKKRDDDFLKSGLRTATSIKNIMRENKIQLPSGSAALEWGCASGRVLRHFQKEAKRREFWGTDQDEMHVIWAKENLSPPFHFVTCTTYPHLPFPDHKFSFIFGVSVFTHIQYLQDSWLMELNRILKKGGHAIFTINDEHTVKFFLKRGKKPNFLPANFDISTLPNHDVVTIPGNQWFDTHVFFRTAWVRKEWGRYFDVITIKPYAEDFQTAVVLKKR